MKITCFLPNVPNTTITLFNDADDHAAVDTKLAGGAKRNKESLHADLAQDRVNADLKKHVGAVAFQKLRLVPVSVEAI